MRTVDKYSSVAEHNLFTSLDLDLFCEDSERFIDWLIVCVDVVIVIGLLMSSDSSLSQINFRQYFLDRNTSRRYFD